MNTQRVEVFYTGRVQGVGFRSTTHRISESLTVRGWVKNLPDGRVQLVGEGERQELQRFLDAIDATLGEHIRERSVDWQIPQHEPNGFRIAY